VSVRTLNLKRARLVCLRCGRHFWTDRCHRICKQCTADTKEPFVKAVLRVDGLSIPGDYRLAEELGLADDDSDTTTIADGTVEDI